MCVFMHAIEKHRLIDHDEWCGRVSGFACAFGHHLNMRQ